MSYLQSFDKNMQRTGFLVDADQVQRKRRLNSDYELSFLVPMSSEDYIEKILLKGHIMDDQGQYYVINSRKRDRSGKKRMAIINCMHIMFKMADFKFPYSSYIDEAFGVSLVTLTNLISAATNSKYTFVIDGTFDAMDVKDFGRGNALQVLNYVVNLYGAEVDPDNFVIHLNNKIGDSNSPHQYRLKKNIISDSFTDDVRTLTTRMYSQMKDGLTFIDLPASNLTTEEYDLLNAIPGAIVGGLIKVNYLISPYWEQWSNDTNTYFDNELVNQNIEDPLELLEATRKALRENEVPQLDINIKAADLYKIDYEETEPHLGDNVKCIDPGMEMNSIDARIIALVEYPYDKNRHAEVNLANFMRRDYTDIIADLDASKRIVDNLISGGKVRTDTFEAFARQAVIDINNSKTEVKYDSRGIVLQSTVNPLHLVVHSSAGTYMTKDGGVSDLRTAITSDGIAAPYIVGILGEFATVKTDNLIAGSVLITSAMINSINADKINVGTLTGFTIQTAASGQRIVQDINGLRSYDASNVKRLSITPSTAREAGMAGFEVFDSSGNYGGVIFGTAGGGMWVLGENSLILSSWFNDTVIRDDVNFSAANISGLDIGDVSGLVSALNFKSDISHNHGNTYTKAGGAQNIKVQALFGFLEVFVDDVLVGKAELV